MERRTFLRGLLGVAGVAVGATIATRAEAAGRTLQGAVEPPRSNAAAGAERRVAEKLPENLEVEKVQYRRRYYGRRYYRRPPARWRPARRRVCRVTRNRRGRTRRVCYFR